MANKENADNIDIDNIRSIVFESIFESRFFTDSLLFQYIVRTGAAKLIILSESLNIVAKILDVPLSNSIILDYDYLLKIDRIQSSQEYSSSYDTLTMTGSPLDNIESERTFIYKELSKIMFSGSRAEAVYIDSKESFDQIVYTMIRNRDYNLVREVYFQVIESKDSFGDFSRRFSAGPETLGVVGPAVLKAHLRFLIGSEPQR